MKLHKSEEQAEVLNLMRKKVNNELFCLKEKTKEEMSLWSGLTTKFVMIKAFSDHLASTVELIEKQSREAERSKCLLEGTMSEQLIFLSRATLEISDFSAGLSYSEHERALCALHHGKLRDELKDLEECLAQAVSEAADMAKYKEMIEGQLSAAKEISNRDEATLLRIQESLLSNTEEAEHPCELERLGSERSSTSVEKLSFQVAYQLEAIRKSLQSQVEEHTSYATYLEHYLASRQEITEDKPDALQEVLQATQRKSVQASLEIQSLNQVIGTLKEHDDESAALVADLRQEVAEAKDTLNKYIEEAAHQKVIEAVEAQNLNDVIMTLKDHNDESTAIVANLRQEVADATDTLNKQVEESTQRMTLGAAEVKNLNEIIRTLKDQNEESAALVANLKQEVAEANYTLSKQLEETAQRMVVEAAEVQNFNEVIRILNEQNAEAAMLAQSAAESCADLKQELVKARDALHKQVEESAQEMAAKTVEVHNLSEMINTLKEQNAEIAELAQNAAECRDVLKQQLAESTDALHKQVKESTQQLTAKALINENMNELMNTIKEQNAESAELAVSLRREVAEVKDALNKQVEETAQQKAVEAAEIQDLNEVIRTLKGQNDKSAELMQTAAECCANLRQELVEAKDALRKQVEESAQKMAVKKFEVQNLNELINTLKEQISEDAKVVASLRQEVAQAEDSLNKQVEESAQRLAVEAAEVQNLNELINTLKEQIAEDAKVVASLRQEVAQAEDSLNKQVEESAQRLAVEAAEVQNLNELIRILKEQNAESAASVENAAECCTYLRQGLAEANDALHKQVEESAQQMAAKNVEAEVTNEVIKTLNEQNVESAELVAKLRQEVAEGKETLRKQVEQAAQKEALGAAQVENLNELIKSLRKQNDEGAALVARLEVEVAESEGALSREIHEASYRKGLEAADIQNLNTVIRTLKEQNAESVALIASLKQELAEAQNSVNKKANETAQQKAVKVQNLNEVIRTVKKQNVESAKLVARLRQKVAEAEDGLNKQVEESAQRLAVKTFEAQKMNEVIRTLQEQIAESVNLVARLRQNVAEAKDGLNKQVEESAQRLAVKTFEAQKMNEVIRTLQEQIAESVNLVARLRQEVAEAKNALDKQVKDTIQRKTMDAAEVHDLNEVIRILKEQNAESAELAVSLRREVAEVKDALNKQVEETAQQKAVEAAEIQDLNEVIRTLKGQNDKSAELMQTAAECCANLRQELVEAKDALNKQIEESAQRMAVKTVEAQMMDKVINTLKEENVESAKLVASLRQELAETKETLKKQTEETGQWKSMEASEVYHLNEVIRVLKEQNAESAELVASLRHEVAVSQDSLSKQVLKMIQWKTVKAVEVQNLNESIKILKGQDDESVVLIAKLRQEVTQAKDALDNQIEEAAQRKAIEAVEVQNLHELITVLKEQNAESSALVVNLRQEVTEAKVNVNSEPEEMEVELFRYLVDDCHHTFKDLSELKSWYTTDILEECPEHDSSVNFVEKHSLRNLIISFRGQHLPELKRLGAHLKYAMVASVSAYTKLIEDTLQEKDNLKDEISNMQKKNYELCHQMVTAEKRLMNLMIQSKSDLRAKEDVLARHLKEISQRNVQDTMNAKSDCITQNMEMSQQKPRHASDDCVDGSALNGLQSTQKDVMRKARNEPQSKRLKSSQATNSAGGDDVIVVSINNKAKRSTRAKAADTNNARQNCSRRYKDILKVKQEGFQSKRLSQTERFTETNRTSKSALQQSRAKDSSSPELVDLTFLDSLLDTYEDKADDPYAF